MSNDRAPMIMISAGFEHGGNVTLRFLDGHPELFVYPFESQLGNRYFVDFLTSLERFQYRYPEFPADVPSEGDYELFFDEEMKTFLRKRNGSKFGKADLVMNESDRIAAFNEFMSKRQRTRANLVEAFFRSTFDAWTNYKRSGKNRVYVGYSPIIGIDSDRILADFPQAHVVHVVRNPFSAYSDTKKRPFPLPLPRYAMSWNLYHHIVLMHQQRFPRSITILRYEDLVADPKKAMTEVANRVGIAFNDSMLYPSWNGTDISNNIYPWGTIARATTEENRAAMDRLTKDEKTFIAQVSGLMIKQFGYDDMLRL